MLVGWILILLSLVMPAIGSLHDPDPVFGWRALAMSMVIATGPFYTNSDYYIALASVANVWLLLAPLGLKIRTLRYQWVVLVAGSVCAVYVTSLLFLFSPHDLAIGYYVWVLGAFLVALGHFLKLKQI